MKEGDILRVRVVGVHDWGVDVAHDDAVGFVQPIELSWTPGVSPHEVVSLGDEVDVRVYALTERRFFASIRQASPGGDPWQPENLPRVGDVCEGAVAEVAEWGIKVRLACGIGAMIVPPPPKPMRVGTRIRVQVRLVEPSVRRLLVGYAEGTE